MTSYPAYFSPVDQAPESSHPPYFEPVVQPRQESIGEQASRALISGGAGYLTGRYLPLQGLETLKSMIPAIGQDVLLQEAAEAAQEGREFNLPEAQKSKQELESQVLKYFPAVSSVQEQLEHYGVPALANSPESRAAQVSGTSLGIQRLMRTTKTSQALGAFGGPIVSWIAEQNGVPPFLAELLGISYGGLPFGFPKAQKLGSQLSELPELLTGRVSTGPEPTTPVYQAAAEVLSENQFRAFEKEMAQHTESEARRLAAVRQKAEKAGKSPDIASAHEALQHSAQREAAPLNNRITLGGEQINFKPVSEGKLPDATKDARRVFSAVEWPNKRKAGLAVMKDFNAMDRMLWDSVGELYGNARASGRAITLDPKNLVSTLRNVKSDILSKGVAPGPLEHKIAKSIDDIIEGMVIPAQTAAEGRIQLAPESYRQVNVEQLVDQIQLLHGNIKFDFAHGDASKKFTPVVNALKEEAYAAAQRVNPQAAEELALANQGYMTWNHYFNGKTGRQLRNANNKNYTKTYESLLHPDQYHEVAPVLNSTRRVERWIALCRQILLSSISGSISKIPFQPQVVNMIWRSKNSDQSSVPKRCRRSMQFWLSSVRQPRQSWLVKSVCQKWLDRPRQRKLN